MVKFCAKGHWINLLVLILLGMYFINDVGLNKPYVAVCRYNDNLSFSSYITLRYRYTAVTVTTTEHSTCIEIQALKKKSMPNVFFIDFFRSSMLIDIESSI